MLNSNAPDSAYALSGAKFRGTTLNMTLPPANTGYPITQALRLGLFNRYCVSNDEFGKQFTGDLEQFLRTGSHQPPALCNKNCN